MKKLIFIFSQLLFVCYSFAQTTETYLNSQRYFFDTLHPTGNTLCSTAIPGSSSIFSDPNRQPIFVHPYSTSNPDSITVYGVAVPFSKAISSISGIDYFCDNPGYLYVLDTILTGLERRKFIVLLMVKDRESTNTIRIVDTASVRYGINATKDTYFVMPGFDDEANQNCCPNQRVVEVYFRQPITAADTFLVGNNIKIFEGIIGQCTKTNTLDTNIFILRTDYDYSSAERVSNVDYTSVWYEIFPIIAPPPCFKPAYPRVSNIGAWHATVRWDIPVGVQFFNLEYGPAGFTPGTGTTILNIYADSCLLSGLTELTQYDVYITGWCSYQQTFSDTVHIDFTTRPLCDTAQGLNATRTNTIIRAWWQQPATADFSELEYGPRNFAPGSGTTISPVNANAAHSCVVVIDSLTPGTDYTLRVRSWCSPTSSFSDWVQMDISTVASPVQPDAPVMSLSPNPAEGSVLVSLSDIMTLLELRDLQGRTLLSISPNSPQAVIDLSNLPAAVYIVTASSPSGSASRKLTVK